jgi:hypothetical protein
MGDNYADDNEHAMRDAAEECVELWADHDDDRSRRIAKVCRAWLADHLDDDAEPVTAEWLKRAGFVSEDPECPHYWIALYPDLNPAFTVELVEGSVRHAGWIGDPNDRMGWPWDICSRRQVRDICRALGATLTERAK